MTESRGEVLLEELGERIGRDELTAYLREFAVIASPDRSLTKLHALSGPQVDLARLDAPEAVLDWLRSWGCRHLRRADTRRSAEALRSWWEHSRSEIPTAGVPLTDLDLDDIAGLSRAYEALARLPAAGRTTARGEVDVRFGDTAAAKTLFAIRPEAVPPWDEPIRVAFGLRVVDAERFARFLQAVQEAVGGLATRFSVAVSDLPSALGRPTSSAVKIIDEYLWIRITRGL